MKVDWKKVWTAFNKWCDNDENAICKECGHRRFSLPDWEDQVDKIQAIVNAQLKRTK